MLFYKRKIAKYKDPCKEVGIVVFRPLSMDTLGAWSDTMVAEVKRMGSRLAKTRGDEGEAIRHLIQRVAGSAHGVMWTE